MAQGNHKLGKKKKSGGAQKRKAGNASKHKRKGGNKIENNKAKIATTKAINRKNERIVAAKALNGGTNFFLKDISERGKNESKRQLATRDKKQNKPSKLTDRLKQTISKLK